MARISITTLRKRLPIGTTFTGLFLGNHVAVTTPTRRRVVRQSARQMVCELLEGEYAWQEIYCEWKGVQALDSFAASTCGKILITLRRPCPRGDLMVDFLEITDIASRTARRSVAATD